MQHRTLAASVLLALAAPAAAQWSDNFESYSANQLLDNVGGWFGWDNTPAAAATVDATRSRSFPNSLLVGATTDAVHPALGATSGKWVLTAWQYIPTGGLAGDIYLILNNVYNHGGPYQWTTELRAVATSGMVVDDFRTNTPQPVVFDQWVEYRVEIDLDADTVSNFYNGALVSQGRYAVRGGPAAIENIDLFSTGGTCNWDDISLEWRGDGFETYAPATLLSDVGGWFGWDNTPAAAGTADNTRARTGSNSIAVSATTDAVHPGIGLTSGRWTFSAWQYIPTGSLGGDIYLILNNVYNHGGPYQWTTELRAVATTGMVVDDFRASTPQPVVFDQWVEYRIDIDLDSNLVRNYYNGALISQGVYAVRGGPVAIENIDLFSTGGTCNWDDICITRVSPPPCFEHNIGTALAMTDDRTVAQALGFTFPYPGGSTTDVAICSNGFIWLDPAQTSTDFSNSIAEFLGSVQATPRIAAAWRDFNPAATGSDDVYFNSFGDRAVITWHNVVRYNGTSPMTVQCQMLADGSVHVFFDAAYDLTGGTLSEGRTLCGIKAAVGMVADPGNTDYSNALPVSTTVPVVYEFIGDSVAFDLAARCIRFEPNTLGGYDVSFRADCGATSTPFGAGCPAGSPVSMTTDAPPVLGSTISFEVTNVPTNTTAAALLLGFGNTNIPLDMLGFPGCSSYTTMNLPILLPYTPPRASVMVTIPVQPQLIGGALYGQAAIVENTVVLYTSNGVTLVFGKS